MASHDFFAHIGSDGRTPFQRMQDAGYPYRRATENVAAGVQTVTTGLISNMRGRNVHHRNIGCDGVAPQAAAKRVASWMERLRDSA